MDSYQAIYDAVRSRISGGNIADALHAAIRNANIGHYFMLAGQSFCEAASEQIRPSVLFRPDLALDGNKFSALYGSNLMDGCAGFGDTAEEAMRDFDKNWSSRKAPRPEGQADVAERNREALMAERRGESHGLG